MKRILFSLLASFLVSVACAQNTTWTWDMYKVKFNAASNFVVSENNSEIFSAGNGHINLTIYPQKNVSTEYPDMVANLRTWAVSTALTFDMEPEFLEDLNGYWGVYIDGTASNGNPTSVVLLIDPDYPEIGLYIWLQYQPEYLDAAVEILSSFTPN